MFIVHFFVSDCITNNKCAKQSAKSRDYLSCFSTQLLYSNDDLQSDLKGLQQKSDYLKELSVTSIQLLPLYESVFFHNYFATDFKKIDPEFGTMQDYIFSCKRSTSLAKHCIHELVKD